jgi:flagellin
MSSNITLSAGIRQNLLSLQSTASLISLTQNRLATGKKVNSALDNPNNFFTSASLSDRATDLNALLDSIGQAQQTLKAADNGITSLTSLVQSAKSIATQAIQATKGTVNYTNITGTQAMVTDITKVTSGTVAGTGVASTLSSSDLKASGIGHITAGTESVVFTVGGVSKTFNRVANGNANAANGTWNSAAELISAVNDATGGFGGAAANVAVAATDGAGGVTVTSLDATKDVTASSAAAAFVAGDHTDVAHALGDALTISDGTYSHTFYRVAANANVTNGTYTSSTDLFNAIQASNIHTSGVITAADNSGKVDLTTPLDGSITVGGAMGQALGFATTAYKNNYNTTLAGLTGDLTVQVGSNTVHTITFGTGTGQVASRTSLNAALAAFTDITGSVDATGHINFAPTSSDPVTIGGKAANLTALGLASGSVTPTGTVVTANTTRSNLQTQFNDLLTQIDQLAKDASYNGVNLMYGDNLKVTFNENGSSTLSISGVKFDSTGLGLSSVSGTGFQDNKVINDTLGKIDTALTSLRTQGSKFGSNLTTVQTRQDFTKSMINTLQTGADNLVLADSNEEAANVLALQTRQQLSTTALSLANQANQGVLRLF